MTKFDHQQAQNFDKRNERLLPIKDALHFCLRALMYEMPADANVLCMGVGTGAELLYLAEQHPQWRFMALDPSGPMLSLCREKVEQAGFGDRCEYHEGYLETLPGSEQFDLATSILVSHFITDLNERKHYFKSIAARLKPDACLVNADLAADQSDPGFDTLLSAWLSMLALNGSAPEEIQRFQQIIGKSVVLLGDQEYQTLLKDCGYRDYAVFYQMLLVRAWVARA